MPAALACHSCDARAAFISTGTNNASNYGRAAAAWCSRRWAATHLLGKHVLKALQHRNNSPVVEGAERLHHSLHVDGPQ